jgi:hypothetical protein
MGMLAEGFYKLITDPAHWGLEFVSEAAFFVVELLILDRLLHAHDEWRKR